MYQIRTLPAFRDNYIWLIGKTDSLYVAAVDPGAAEPVFEALESAGLELAAILITHHHPDHTGGIRALTERYPVPIYGPANESIPAITHPVKETERIELEAAGLQFQVLDTPGHTRGHVCYLLPGSLFCGDTLFAAGCGRLFEGTPEQMYRSLGKIAALPGDTLIYCAHEYTLDNLKFALVVEPDNPDILARQQQALVLRSQGLPTVPSSLSLELKTNPFLRSEVPAVKQAAERFAGHGLNGGSEIFATVRHWKDTLD